MITKLMNELALKLFVIALWYVAAWPSEPCF